MLIMVKTIDLFFFQLMFSSYCKQCLCNDKAHVYLSQITHPLKILKICRKHTQQQSIPLWLIVFLRYKALFDYNYLSYPPPIPRTTANLHFWCTIYDSPEQKPLVPKPKSSELNPAAFNLVISVKGGQTYFSQLISFCSVCLQKAYLFSQQHSFQSDPTHVSNLKRYKGAKRLIWWRNTFDRGGKHSTAPALYLHFSHDDTASVRKEAGFLAEPGHLLAIVSCHTA